MSHDDDEFVGSSEMILVDDQERRRTHISEYYDPLQENNTLGMKHITCFQWHVASKLFSETVVALPFSQYWCGEVV